MVFNFIIFILCVTLINTLIISTIFFKD